MNPRDEDDAWRAIVENFGERAVLDEELPSAELDLEALEGPDTTDRAMPGVPETDTGTPEAPNAPQTGHRSAPESHGPFVPGPEHEYEPIEQSPRPADPFAMHDDEGRFVPPSPPLPYVPPKRLLAWASLALVPIILVVAALTSRPMSGSLATIFVAAWVFAFCYLIWTMPDEPRDPFDDGSRV